MCDTFIISYAYIMYRQPNYVTKEEFSLKIFWEEQ